jgi:hypothetical protein
MDMPRAVANEDAGNTRSVGSVRSRGPNRMHASTMGRMSTDAAYKEAGLGKHLLTYPLCVRPMAAGGLPSDGMAGPLG